jgi:H+/Cl- antiporter ClcA
MGIAIDTDPPVNAKGRYSLLTRIVVLLMFGAQKKSEAFAPSLARHPVGSSLPISMSLRPTYRSGSRSSRQASNKIDGEDSFFLATEQGIGDPMPPEYPVDTVSSSSSATQNGATFVFLASALIGVLSGFAVSMFKLSIESLREVMYGTSFAEHCPVALIPALGGVGVALLMTLGEFSPGLRGAAQEVDAISLNTVTDDRFTNAARFLRKPLAAIVTLGTGNSLGPEGPSVEVGMTVSRLCMPSSIVGSETDAETVARIKRNRLLLSAGASAGVSAGFNAPLAGVFFSLEILQQSLPPLKPLPEASSGMSDDGKTKWFQPASNDYLSTSTGSITAVLIASVLSALVSRVYLGESLALSVPSYELNAPLVELPLYLLLGVTSGVVAGVFTFCAQLSKAFFDGNAGPQFVQGGMRRVPKWCKPIMGGLTCGVVGLVYPQILFFGYETLNTLLANNSLTTDVILTLLAVKIFTTAVAAGSGLVGGTFAPSLFLGGMVGASFHNVVGSMFLVNHESPFALADVQAYALVGAAGVLAALFKAPLTGSLLLFELTRDYEVLLPALASAGVGSIIGDLIEKALEETSRDRDAVSWGDLADEDEEKVKARKQAS